MKRKPRKIKVLLADDHLIVRMGLSAIISTEPDMTVVAEAQDGEEAVRLAEETAPDVVVMDLLMPKLDGARATTELLARHPDTKIMILTTYGESQDVRRALDAGATSALVKDSSQQDILDAIRATAIGKRIICPEIAAAAPEPVSLSERQIEILTYVAKGFNNREIGEKMSVGPDCVKNHLKTVFSALGAASRSEAVAVAIARGIIAP